METFRSDVRGNQLGLADAVRPATADHLQVQAEPRRQASVRVGLDRSYRVRFLAADVAALVLLGTLGVAWGTPLRLVAVAPLVVVFAFRALGLYAPCASASALDHGSRVMLAASASSLIAGATAHASSVQSGCYAAAATVLLLTGRSAAYAIERRRALVRPHRVLIVGTGATAQEFAERLQRHPEHGMLPVGFVDGNPQPLDPDLGLPVLGTTDLLPHLAAEFAVERVVVDAETVREDEIRDVLDKASAAGVDVVVLPALARHLSTAITVESLAGMTLLAYRHSRLAGVGWTTKRLVDLVLASALLAASLPAWLMIVLAIKLDSPGPVLFRQARVGRRGKPFDVLKFRSMAIDAERRLLELADLNEADGPYFKLARDPRITRVGRWLRRLSLDELPQLLNVVRGEMSLVGPRPALPSEVDRFPRWIHRRLEVPPGLTGLWQVSGRFLLPFHEASRLDVFYVDHWSLGLDLKILLRTPAVVLSGRGAR